MEVGLAENMVYGSGGSQNTKHHYAGVHKVLKKSKKKCGKKKKKM
jgi:hypothetical protein